MLATAVGSVAALAEPPGLLESGGPESADASVGDPARLHALDLARSFAPGQPVAAIVLAFARDLAAFPAAERGGTARPDLPPTLMAALIRERGACGRGSR